MERGILNTKAQNVKQTINIQFRRIERKYFAVSFPDRARIRVESCRAYFSKDHLKCFHRFSRISRGGQMKSSRWIVWNFAKQKIECLSMVKPYPKRSRYSALEKRKCIPNLLSTAFNWYEYWIYRVRDVSILPDNREIEKNTHNCIETALNSAFKQWTLEIGKLCRETPCILFFFFFLKCNNSSMSE